MININYRLPMLGKRTVSFHNDAEEIYVFLDEVGQLSRLKNLNQLGIISDVIQTAHHPRFEYIFFLCYLVDCIKPNIRGHYPVGRELVGTLTGSELMKIWALLLAIGHTPGTFPVEKAILKYLLNNEKIKKRFLNRIKNLEIRKYALKLINENKIYSFYHILSFQKIFRYRDNKRQKRLSGKCAHYLSLYCLPTGKECYLALKELFRKLRMVSYIVLDSYYTGALTPTDLDGFVAKIVSTISDPSFDDLVKSLDSYLLSQIYRWNDSIIAETMLYHAFYEKLIKNKRPLSLIDNYLYSTPDQDICKLYNDFKTKNKIKSGSADFLGPLCIQTSASKVFKQEKDINGVISKFVPKEKVYERLLFDVTRLPRSSRNNVTIYINRNYEFKRVGLLPNLIRIVISEMIRNESSKHNPLFGIKEIRNYPKIQLAVKRETNESNLISIFRFLTQIIFDKRIGSIRFKPKRVPILPDAFFDRRYYRKQCLLEQVVNKKIVNNPEIIKLKTLMCGLLESQNNAKSKFLVYTVNTELQREGRPARKGGFVVGEFDGALLEIRGSRIFMHILEAKKRTRSYGESRKQLSRIKRYLKERYTKGRICRIERIKKGEKSGFLKVKIS